MTQRTFALAMLLIFMALGRLLPWSSGKSVIVRDEGAFEPLVDAESLLASGQGLPLMCADISTLELIPGVSDKLAVEILQRRESIRNATRDRPFEDSLQLARGIGEKNASRVTRYLSLEGTCESAERYSLFPQSLMK
jgi:hypothetical protein